MLDNTWPPITIELEKYILEGMLNRPLNYGSNSITRDLEKQFAIYQGEKFVIATCSGTVALWAAYYGISNIIGPPSSNPPEIIMGGYGFWATATAALYAGLKPVFCDIDPKTGNIDPSAVESKITPRTLAIAITHIAGHPADMFSLQEIARKYSLKVIEDCSHAHGAKLDGQLVGTFGDAAAFSLQTLKMMSAGEGGLLITDDEGIFQRAASLVNIRRLEGTGILPQEGLELTGLGLKLRMSPLSARLASYHLQHLDEFIVLRRKKLDYLTQKLQGIE